MALLYFHKEVSPNCTLTVFSRTNLFPPKADSRGSPGVCVCAGGRGGGRCFVPLSVRLVPALMELLFIFLIFRGRLMTAEEDCIC